MQRNMDMDGLGRKLGLAKDKKVIRKAEELRRLSDLHWVLPCPSIEMPLIKKICRHFVAPEFVPTKTLGSRRKGIPHRSPIY